MKHCARPLAALLIIALLVIAAPTASEGAKPLNRYSLVTLYNKTKFRVYYDYAWGKTDRTWRRSIAPGDSYVHWWKFKRPGEDWAPWFRLRIDGHKSFYKLSSFYSPDTKAANGKEYVFNAKKKDGVWEIELNAKLYTK